jgi:SAM-dependent methyltransferase
MICPVCGHDKWSFERRYNARDKYEKWCGIPEPICRAWYQCVFCGLLKVHHSYDVSLLEPIYTNGYRAKSFRGSSIEQEFQKIIDLPYRESENKQRVNWLQQFLRGGTMLDVGSGLGVFPYEIACLCTKSFRSCHVKTIEPNKDSAAFIRTNLGYDSVESYYEPGLYNQRFNWITCIHVLEHQKKPEDMLLDFKKDLKEDGKIFIEVPDAHEFEYLDKDHDEFNSTHLYFFSYNSLAKLVESCGYKVTDMRRVHTKARNLSRIMMVAEV